MLMVMCSFCNVLSVRNMAFSDPLDWTLIVDWRGTRFSDLENKLFSENLALNCMWNCQHEANDNCILYIIFPAVKNKIKLGKSVWSLYNEGTLNDDIYILFYYFEYVESIRWKKWQLYKDISVYLT